MDIHLFTPTHRGGPRQLTNNANRIIIEKMVKLAAQGHTEENDPSTTSPAEQSTGKAVSFNVRLLCTLKQSRMNLNIRLFPSIGAAESVILDRKILDVRRNYFCLQFLKYLLTPFG